MLSASSLIDRLPNAVACQAALDDLDHQQAQMLDQVQKWALINSGSRNLDGLQRMEETLVAAFAELGAVINFIDLEDTEMVTPLGEIKKMPNGRIIKISKHPQANRRILLTGHYDTVFAKDSRFQTCRFMNKNTLNGPGVADMKGGILVMLYALKSFETTPFSGTIGWDVILSPDEETGSLASAQYLVDHAKNAHIGLTYEPALADGTLAGERKGSGNYTVIVRGRAAHAGREFDYGRNAVVHLAGIISKLSALSGGRAGLTVNPAVITGGTAPNIVPDHAQCQFNVRVNTPEDAEWFEKQVDEIIVQADQADGLTVVLHGGLNRPPKVISPANQALMDMVRDCGLGLGFDVQYVATGGCCEGNNLAAAGLPNVDTLGVRGGAIHSDKEFMIVESLSERAKLSTLIMMCFAAGYLDAALRKANTA